MLRKDAFQPGKWSQGLQEEAEEAARLQAMADAEDEAKVGGAGEEGETRRFWVRLLFSELIGRYYLAALYTTSYDT